jgi:crotonobetainyl-CoA:carnitine CoA-transferase CaiB-like acyl-CoA transferase
MTQKSQAPTPFSGIRVIELAQWVFVPAAGALLADWGADVIHVEPLDGDPYRGLVSLGIHEAGKDGVNMAMEATNRNKRSVALDIRSERGMAVLLELVAGADVFLTNFRPSALERRGLDPETLRARNPRLVYARGNGFGANGPDRDRAGYDASAFWARGGLAHILTPPVLDHPIQQRGAFGDRSGGMAIAFGIASALFQRERTGEGATVDVSLLATAMWILTSDLLSALQGGTPRAGFGGVVPNPLLTQYRTSDDRHISLVFLQPDRYWADFCRLLGRDELIDDPRFDNITSRAQHSTECVEILQAEFSKRTYTEWCELLNQLDAPWAPVQAVEELLTDPQIIANGYVQPVDTEGGPEFSLPSVPVQFDGHPASLHRAPEHGEHTERVLLEMGYDWDTIGELQREGVIP